MKKILNYLSLFAVMGTAVFTGCSRNSGINPSELQKSGATEFVKSYEDVNQVFNDLRLNRTFENIADFIGSYDKNICKKVDEWDHTFWRNFRRGDKSSGNFVLNITDGKQNQYPEFAVINAEGVKVDAGYNGNNGKLSVNGKISCDCDIGKKYEESEVKQVKADLNVKGNLEVSKSEDYIRDYYELNYDKADISIDLNTGMSFKTDGSKGLGGKVVVDLSVSLKYDTKPDFSKISEFWEQVRESMYDYEESLTKEQFESRLKECNILADITCSVKFYDDNDNVTFEMNGLYDLYRAFIESKNSTVYAGFSSNDDNTGVQEINDDNTEIAW